MAPIISAPPGRFSMMTGWPQVSRNRWMISRPSTSSGPPGAVGTTILTVLFGKPSAWFCAAALPLQTVAAQSAAAMMKRCSIAALPLLAFFGLRQADAAW